ncbi:UNVERIFIED_CONTAM: hypothetical protein RMT77_009029 [Armadillidium vulgare]
MPERNSDVDCYFPNSNKRRNLTMMMIMTSSECTFTEKKVARFKSVKESSTEVAENHAYVTDLFIILHFITYFYFDVTNLLLSNWIPSSFSSIFLFFFIILSI